MDWKKTWKQLRDTEKEYSRLSFSKTLLNEKQKNEISKEQKKLSLKKADLQKELDDLSKS